MKPPGRCITTSKCCEFWCKTWKRRWNSTRVNGLIVSARNGRTGAVKENNLRRLREAATLHHLLTCDV
ncbi:hypothetical protein PAHAL_3G325100 [Panicum hallii]|uniref:Uncharacterized protein n=1 Tax=Panicum hallii TaxID=206008 RepID=A0A2T8KK47_9POAL|nr:hypothetical protein PAHAL_3G324400 [Panicum hallii]PVH62563.1 hypothetical protein PAHAL_3G325100 [Panicum hallii]